jgi:hypothetical protein
MLFDASTPMQTHMYNHNTAGCPASAQADLPLVLPSPALGANIFADWPRLNVNRSWPWTGQFNEDPYFGGAELQAMAQLIYIARALQATAPAAGSTFGPTASAAAVNVTSALRQLLQRRLTLPCRPTNPGSLCYDSVFRLVTTARAQGVSAAASIMLRNIRHLACMSYCDNHDGNSRAACWPQVASSRTFQPSCSFVVFTHPVQRCEVCIAAAQHTATNCH